MKIEKNIVEYNTLLKFSKNQASKAEVTKITNWLSSEAKDFKREKYLHILWDDQQSIEAENDVDFEAILDKIHHNIQLRSRRQPLVRLIPSGQQQTISINKVLRNLSRIAAIFLLPVMAYIGWEIINQKMWVKSQTAIVYNEIKCPLGAQSRFELPDGTTGNLNNGSVLRYPTTFTGETREVDLYGEAFFDVEHNKKRPFIINTSGLDIKVLGTRLNVYSYPDEDYQEITLESGSVELIQKGEEKETMVAKMKPGQHAIYSFNHNGDEVIPKSSEKDVVIVENKEQMENIMPRLKSGKKALLNTEKGDLFVQYTDTDPYTGWTEGKLILRNDPMPVLLKRIERWYSVKFNINDDRINDYTYWATFEEENLEQVLRLLSLTGPVKFTMLPRTKKEDGSFNIQEIDVSVK